MDDAARRTRVDVAIANALDALAAAIAPATHGPEELLTPVAALASKGKRMRALLLLTAHDACGGNDAERAYLLAGALELFQTAALIHDDVLDRSDTRRGMPSTHRALEALHRDEAWLGDSEKFGESGAILAGDMALMACQQMLTSSLAGLPQDVAAAVGQRFGAMASLCTAGQYLDIRLAAQPLSELALGNHTAEIFATMRAKTASYTAEGPLALGAALAGAPAPTVDAWAGVGVPLGIAFQLRDDVLGVVGSPESTGKPAGDDIREGKRTLMLALALDRTRGEDHALLGATVGNESAPDADVAAAVDVIIASGALTAVESEIHLFAAKARDALVALTMANEHRARLEALIDATVSRSS